MVKGKCDDESRRWCEERGQKSRKTREVTETTHSGDKMFGVRIEDGRESRDEEARLEQILLTVSNGIRKKA
jgi:hypothetical protein